MVSLSSIGHNVANAARAVVQFCGDLMGKMVELGKKPFGSPTAAKTPPELITETPLVKRDVESSSVTGSTIEDYGGLNQAEEAALASSKRIKDELLEGLVTKRQIGGGEDFSDERIDEIKASASRKVDALIERRIKLGTVPDRQKLAMVIGDALFSAMLELPENQGLTDHQKAAAWKRFHEVVDMNIQKRERNPQWGVPELLGIPQMQDHIDEHNTSRLLDRATYPIMTDVRDAKEEDRPVIKGGQNGMVAQYVSMIRGARSEGSDVASIDKVIGPKLMASLSAEMDRVKDSPGEKIDDDKLEKMTDEQFHALTDLYKDIYNSTKTHTKEEVAFLKRLTEHPRARVS
ncbi:MAG: hypothetical protein Tsb0018_00570 [Opitutales bacterium]